MKCLLAVLAFTSLVYGQIESYPPLTAGGVGSVTSFGAPSGSWPSWCVPTVTNPTTTPVLTVACAAIPLSVFATQVADSVVMNATGGAAAPTAVVMPVCTSGADLYNTTTHAWGCAGVGTITGVTAGTGLSGGGMSGTVTVALLPAVVTISTSGPVTVSSQGFFLNNAAGALIYNLPVIVSGTVGNQYCFRNYTGVAGAITLQAPASTTMDVLGSIGSTAGTLVSGGALGDASCVVAISTTQYFIYVQSGTWTNN